MAKAEVFLPILGGPRAQIIVNAVVVFLVLVVVTLRVIGRMMGPGFGWDDALVVCAVPLGVAMLVCQGLFAPVGNGYDLADHPTLAKNIPFILELTFGMQAVYVVLLALVKASMLFFFLRVFVTPFMQRAAKIALVFIGAWAISYVFACIFLCTPVSAQWTGLGTCGAYIPLIQSLIATNAIGDVIIMALPMHSIWGLNMRKTDKAGITASFALGTACVVCAVFRLIYISSVDLNANITGTMPPTIFLFILEPNLAILCVSIPMLRPFYVRYKRRVGGSRLEKTDYNISGGQRSGGHRSGQGSLGNAIKPQNDNLTNWEMDDYYPQSKHAMQDTVVTSGPGDETSSERSLTRPHSSGRRMKDEILVQTKFTVSRDI